ncbi:hypothetical protein Tco_1359808 [Tanacetum coccineum]
MPLETLRLWNDLSDPCHDTPMVDRIETDGGSHGDYRKHFTLVFGIRKSNAMSRTAYADAGSCGMSRFKKKYVGMCCLLELDCSAFALAATSPALSLRHIDITAPFIREQVEN